MDCVHNHHVLQSTDIYERYTELFQSGHYSDLIVEVTNEANDEKTHYMAHSALIAASSPVMEALLKYANNNVLSVTNYCPEVVVHILYYIYTKNAPFMSIEICLDVMSAADFYDMPQLMMHCVNYIIKMIKTNVQLDIFVKVLNNAFIYNLPILFNAGCAYLENHSEIVINSNEINTLNVEPMLTILMLKNCICSEMSILKMFLKWAAHNKREHTLLEFIAKLSFTDYFCYKQICQKEMESFFDDNYDLFSFEDRFTTLYLLSMSSPKTGFIRSYPNENNHTEVIVSNPPYSMIEEFFYIGGPMPTFEIHLAKKQNSFIREFNENYEEDVTFNILNQSYSVKGDYGKSGLIYTPPLHLAALLPSQSITVEVVLKKCGYYKKIFTARKAYSFHREGAGIINLYEIQK